MAYESLKNAAPNTIPPVNYSERYVKNDAPIIIHLKPEILSLLIKDPEHLYRSQFETGTTRGSLIQEGRKQWEDTIFGLLGRERGATPTKTIGMCMWSRTKTQLQHFFYPTHDS